MLIEVLMTMVVENGSGERISVIMWIVHKVGRRGGREQPFQDRVVREDLEKGF